MVVGEFIHTHTCCCNRDYIQSACAALYNKAAFMVVGEHTRTHIVVTETTYSQHVLHYTTKAAFMVVGEHTHIVVTVTTYSQYVLHYITKLHSW